MEVNNQILQYIPVPAPAPTEKIIPPQAYPIANTPQYQYQYYQYPQYNPNNSPIDVNSSMRSQTLPARSNGYREITSFNVPYVGTGKFYKLDNGQNVIIIPKKGMTTIKTYAKVGSFNEAKNRGISHFIEHNLFNGSSKLGPNEFVEKTTKMGGQYNAGTNTASTDYYITSPMHKDGDFERFMEMHADMLTNPTFSDKMIEKEKGPVISEIQMYEDDPNDKAFNLVIKNLFNINTDCQGLIAGNSKTIANLTRNDVVDYYNQWYRPDNMTTVIVGDVNPDAAIKTTSKLFNQKKATPSESLKTPFYEPMNVVEKPVRVDFNSPRVDAVSLNMAFAGPSNNNIKETIVVQALCNALTGYENAPLVKDLKTLNTKGSFDSDIINPNPNAPQVIMFGAMFAPGKEEDGLKAVYSNIYNLASKPITDNQMLIVKNKLKNNLSLVSESSSGVADLVGRAVNGHGSLEMYSNIDGIIDSLTPQDLQAAAQKYLDLNKTSIVVVHPENKAQKGASKLAFGGSTDKFKINNVKEYDLPNNLRVAIHDDPNSTRASAVLAMKTDNFVPTKPGVAEVLSLMLTKGTKNYSEEEFNKINDDNNLGILTSAANNGLTFFTDTSEQNLPMAINLFKEILYNPDLNEKNFNKSKEEIKLACSSELKDPTDKALETLFPDYPIGITNNVILKNIDSITLQDVKNLHQSIISNSQGNISINAPISKNPALEQELFSTLSSGIGAAQKHHITTTPYSKDIETPIVFTEAEKRNQADIVQIFKIKNSKNVKDAAALTVLNQVLGGNSQSKLFSDLRETQKLAYKVKSTLNTDENYGYLKLLIKTTTEDDLKGATHENLQKSLDGFKKHLNALMTTPITDEELETAKMEAKTNIIDGSESSLGKASIISGGIDRYYGVNYYNKMLQSIDKLTPQDIQKAAIAYLNKPSAISLIASPDTISTMKPYLNTLGKVEEVQR